jgi:hypothetical protein
MRRDEDENIEDIDYGPEPEPDDDDPYGASRIDWPAFWSRDHNAEEWLVEPLLPHGRAVALYSPAKQGKSLLVLDVAARLATGGRVLDRQAGAPVDVLYLDLEMTEDDLHDRLTTMGYGPDTDLGHLHYYLLPSLPPLDTPAGGEAVLGIAARHNAQLVIIDTTARVLSGNENDADTVRAFHQHVGLPLKAAGVTVWRLDHAGKDLTRGQRGTSAKNDDVDLVWELSRRDDGLRLRATHRRQSWIPESIDLVFVEGPPFRHELLAGESFPEGTRDLAERLDAMGIPLDWGGNRVRKALRDAGHKARTDVVAAAIRYRKPVPGRAGTGFRDAPGTGIGDRSKTRFGDRVGDRSGQGFAVDGDSSAPLGADSPPTVPRTGPKGRVITIDFRRLRGA